MIRVLAFCLSLLFFVAPNPAYAAVIGTALAAIESFAAVSAVNAFVVRFASGIILTALSAALAPKQKIKSAGIKTEATTSGGDNPQSFIIGRYATAGNMMAPPYSRPNSGDVPNRFLTYVVDLADMPITGLSRLIVNGEYVTDLAAGTGHWQQQGLVSGSTPHVLLNVYDGNQTAADPYMLANFAGHSERPWGADMVGTGIAYANVTFRYNRKLFNGLPRVRFEVDGIPLYDPRKDSSIGGSGAHRWTDPSTWEFTENLAVMIYNILRGISLPGGVVWGGSVAAVDLPLANWFTAMNACDQLIEESPGVFVPAYRGGLEIRVDETPADVIDELLKGCAGSIVEIGGVYKIRVGAPGLPTFFITDQDIASDASGELRPFPRIDQIYNGVRASHPEPESLWENTDAPPLSNSEWETEDGGRSLVASLQFPAAPFSGQVQRLMQAMAKDHRRFRQHNNVLGPRAAVLEPLDVVAWTSERNGYDAKSFEVGELVDDLTTRQQSIGMRERESGDFVWDPVDLVTTISPSTAPEIPIARSVPGWDVDPHTIVDHDGNPRRPAIALKWDKDEVDDASGLDFEVRASGQTELVANGGLSDLSSGSVVVSEGISRAVVYEARAILITEQAAIWTNWTSVAAPNVGVDQADFADALNEELQGAVSDALEAKRLATSTTTALGAANMLPHGAFDNPDLWVSHYHTTSAYDRPNSFVSDIDGAGTPGYLHDYDAAHWMYGRIPIQIYADRTYRLSIDMLRTDAVNTCRWTYADPATLNAATIAHGAKILNVPAIGAWANVDYEITGQTILDDLGMSGPDDKVLIGISVDHSAVHSPGDVSIKNYRMIDLALEGLDARISTVELEKVGPAGALAAVETEISASYGDLSTMATETKWAVAGVEDMGSGFMLRARAGGAVGEMELVAVSDPFGSHSTFLVSADRMVFRGGMALFEGTELRSDGYVEDGSGWMIDKNGNSQFNDLIVTGAMLAPATLKTLGPPEDEIWIDTTTIGWAVPADGVYEFFAAGAGGSGAAYAAGDNSLAVASGGAPGAYGRVMRELQTGQVVSFVIGLGGAARTNNNDGIDGGTTSITGPGINLICPGGRGGEGGITANSSISRSGATCDPATGSDVDYTPGGSGAVSQTGNHGSAATYGGALGVNVTSGIPVSGDSTGGLGGPSRVIDPAMASMRSEFLPWLGHDGYDFFGAAGEADSGSSGHASGEDGQKGNGGGGAAATGEHVSTAISGRGGDGFVHIRFYGQRTLN